MPNFPGENELSDLGWKKFPKSMAQRLKVALQSNQLSSLELEFPSQTQLNETFILFKMLVLAREFHLIIMPPSRVSSSEQTCRPDRNSCSNPSIKLN
jgi:hypothetical protein